MNARIHAKHAYSRMGHKHIYIHAWCINTYIYTHVPGTSMAVSICTSQRCHSRRWHCLQAQLHIHAYLRLVHKHIYIYIYIYIYYARTRNIHGCEHMYKPALPQPKMTLSSSTATHPCSIDTPALPLSLILLRRISTRDCKMCVCVFVCMYRELSLILLRRISTRDWKTARCVCMYVRFYVCIDNYCWGGFPLVTARCMYVCVYVCMYHCCLS
jgi:hypothetical protein